MGIERYLNIGHLINIFVNIKHHQKCSFNISYYIFNISIMTKIYLFLELHEYLKEILEEDSMTVVQQALDIADKG